MENNAGQPVKIPIPEARIQEMLNFGDQCLFLWGANGNIVDISLATLGFFEVSSKEAFYKTYDKLSPPYQPDGKPSMATMHEWINLAFVRGSVSFDWLHKRKSGHHMDCRVDLYASEYLGEKVVCSFVSELFQEDTAPSPVAASSTSDHVHVMMDLAPIGCYFIDSKLRRYRLQPARRYYVRNGLERRDEQIDNDNQRAPVPAERRAYDGICRKAAYDGDSAGHDEMPVDRQI